MKLGTWNVKSIKGKEEEIVEEMIKQKIEILGITETKKKGKGIMRIHKGYWFIWSGIDEKERAKEGVGLIVAPNKMINITREKYVNERIMTIEMKLTGEIPWTLITAYEVNEDANKEQKEKFFKALQEEIDEGGENLIIMGDLNGRVGKHNIGIESIMGREGENTRNNNGSRIIELCVENELVITNTKFRHKDIHKYTREQPSRGEKSIIDYFLIRKHKFRLIKDVIIKRQAEIGSDHYMLTMVIRNQKDINAEKRKKIVKEKIKSYKLKEHECKKKYQEITDRKFGKQEQEIEIEAKWKKFKETILETAKECCGTTKITNTNIKRTEWWSEDLKRHIKEKKEAWNMYLNTKRPEDYEKYKETRREVKIAVKKAKEESWTKFGQKMTKNYKENQKLFYGTLKQLKKKKEYNMVNIKDKDGKIITEENRIMERWRQHFMELTENNTNQMEETNDSTNSQEIEEVKLVEVIEAIRKIRLGKAPGKDDITPEMMKYLGEVGIKKLRELFNESIKSRETPKDWSAGIILPIYKNGDKRNCTNYRGITLSSIPGKIMARIVEKRIRDKIDNTIEDTQCGFRGGRSTQDALFILRQISEKIINKNKEVHICYIDLTKAFDRIRREDIWRILEKRGIEKRIIEVIQAMYKNNTNIVRTNNEESKEFKTEIGVKQGCILSPLLFTIVLDEAVKEAKKRMDKLRIGYWKMEEIYLTELMFADDMAIFAESEVKLQRNLDILNQELQKINMEINTNKTKSMIISKEEKTHNVQLNGKKIEQVSSVKYLGAIIEQNGKIDKEINERVGKTGRMFNFMRPFMDKKEIPKHIKTDVVKKIVRPTILYGSESWTITDKHKSKINATDMRFLRKIENKTKRDRIRNEIYRQQLKINPIYDTLVEGQLRWFGHVCRMKEERITKRIYESKTQGKSKKGRPRKTWNEGIREEAERRGQIWEGIKQKTQDRKRWREIYKTQD